MEGQIGLMYSICDLESGDPDDLLEEDLWVIWQACIKPVNVSCMKGLRACPQGNRIERRNIKD